MSDDTGQHRLLPWEDTGRHYLPPPPPRPPSWGPVGKAAIQLAVGVTTAVILGAVGGALITWSQSRVLETQVHNIERRLDSIEKSVQSIERSTR